MLYFFIFFFFNDTATTEIYTLSLHDAFRSVDDVALGVCKTGAEEAGVTEVRTSLSEKKFELWREIKVHRQQIGRAVQQECRDRSRMPSAACKKNTQGLAERKDRQLDMYANL